MIPGTETFALQSLLTFLASLLCLAFKLKPKFAVSAAVGAMLVANGLMLYGPVAEYRELRQRFPLESISGRLVYETKGGALDAASAEPPLLTADAEQRLNLIESRDVGYSIRGVALRTIHSRTLVEFVEAEGFGDDRMVPVRSSPREYIEIPDSEPIPLPVPLDSSSPESQTGPAPAETVIGVIGRFKTSH